MNLATRFSYRNTSSTLNGALAGNVAGPLSEDQLRQFVPSIFAENPHHSRSARYGYIPTIEVVRGLHAEGFRPVFACEAKARDEGKAGYTKHMIRFRGDATLADDAAGVEARKSLGGVPELVMVNSHDGSTAYQLLAGFFRMVCANGLICGDGFGEIRVPHKGNVIDAVVNGAFGVTRDFNRAIGAASAMRQIELQPEAVRVFGEAALALKYYDDEKQEVVAPVTADAIMIPRRYEDSGRSLWTAFNVAQENLIRGGLRGRTVNDAGQRRRSTTRAVNGIDGNVKLNRALWTLTERMAELATGRPIAA